MKFSLASLAECLADYPSCQHYCVALSGGLDSSVLLHAMAALRDSGKDFALSAVHVHHGLQAEADEWVEFCQEQCRQLQIPCELLYVDASPVTGESPEDTARKLRYQAIAALVGEGHVLLTAHHQDDQAETLLLQLMRGCGLQGLAAMPVLSDFSRGKHLRPLLGYAREDLHEYAMLHQLDWIEDSSNEDVRYDRNFMRHEIIPGLTSRWPGLAARLWRTSIHMSEAMSLLDERAAEDLQRVITAERCIISIDSLVTFNEARQRNLLRYWLRDLGLPVPSQVQMQHVISDVIHATQGTDPCVAWPGVEIRAYRQQLYVIKSRPSFRSDRQIAWDFQSALRIEGAGTLNTRIVQGQGISATLQGQQGLSIRFRQGGERIRPARRGHEHELKKLFQEAGVPPWQRGRIPMLFHGEQLVAVAGVCVSESYQAEADQQGVLLDWRQDSG